MKKLISITALLAILLTNFSVISEEQPQFSIAAKIRSFMLVNNPEALERVNEENFKLAISSAEHSDWIQAQGGERPYWTEEKFQWELERIYESFKTVPENSFCFYPLLTIKYSKQYADSFVFNQIVSEDKFWVSVPKPVRESFASTNIYDENYNKVLERISIYDAETIEFLQNPESIEEIVKNEIDEKILDCKIIALRYFWINPDDEENIRDNSVATILYFKGETKDYGIKIYSSPYLASQESDLERYKIYTMAELMQSCGSYTNMQSDKILDTKPTYETEAQALQDEGLIQGTDRGLDLLKPLTRIEATTILVRALGYEDEPTPSTSKFTDIPAGNWGVKYANIAADKGITQGVGDNKFAPADFVTADQFATLVLRSSGTQNFDWQQAVNLLIEQNIITPENAGTMDLFTRGDMAKIIYEARQKGLIN
jgi:hypothetical protein